jgi:integrase
MLLAATGMRAVEALNIRIKDVDFDNKSALIYVRGENTKTKTDRTMFLTEEVASQIDIWLKYKHRTRRICYQNKYDGDDENNTKKTITEYRTASL